MATQVDIIKSDRVALRVVRNLKLTENPQVRQQWLDATEGQGSIEQWLVDAVPEAAGRAALAREQRHQRQLQGARPALCGRRWPTPSSQAYIDTTLELRVDPARQYTTFFDTRAKEAREALEKAQSQAERPSRRRRASSPPTSGWTSRTRA